MKALLTSLALVAASVAAIAADAPAAAPAAAPATMPAGHPASPSAAHPGTPPSGHGAAGPADMSKATAALNKKAKVISVLDAKQFTYMEIQDGSKKLWLVSPTITAKKGDTVSYADSEVMAKFHSGALNRDFTNVVLTTRAVVEK